MTRNRLRIAVIAVHLIGTAHDAAGVSERHALRRAPAPGTGRGGRRGRADRRGRGGGTTSRPGPGQASRTSISAGPAGARVRRRPRARRPGRSRADPVRPVRGARPGRRTSPRSRRTPPTHPEAPVDPRRRLGDAGLPRRDADRRRPRRGGRRPAGLPAQPGPPRRVGQQPGARAGRGRRPDARTRRTAGSSGTPTAPHRDPPRGGHARWSPATSRPTTPTTTTAALLAGQRYLHSLGVTGWQDAIVGDYAGMQDPVRPTRGRPQRRPARRTSSARCGGSATSARSRSPTWSSGGSATATGGSARRASRSCRTASPRTSRPP